MNAFAKRYFIWISLIFLVFTGIFLNKNSLIFFAIFLAIIALLGAVLYYFKRKSKNFKTIFALILLSAVLGSLNATVFLHKNEKIVDEYAGSHKIYGYVAEVSSKERFMSEHIVRIERLDGERVSFDTVFVTDFQSELSLGDFFEAEVVMYPIESYEDYAYLRNENIYDYPLICALKSGTEITYLENEFRLPLMFSSLNSKLSSILKVRLGKGAGELASALLLGNRELLSDSVLRDFKRAGVYHMLALSGLHVAILIGILEFVLKKLFVPMRTRIALLAVLSLFYIALTGFKLSACRSMLMLWTIYLAFIFGKPKDSLTSLFAAVSVIVFIHPSAIFDVGLQLSFLSTFGVISATMIMGKIKYFNRETRFVARKKLYALFRGLVSAILISVCVFVCTLPVVMTYFGEVSLATFFTNLFMGFICEAFLVLALISLLIPGTFVVGETVLNLTRFVGEAMTWIASAIADVRGVMLSLMYPYIEFLVWGAFVGFLIFFGFKFARKWLVAVPVVSFAILFCINVIFYNVSRDDFVRSEFNLGDSVVLSSHKEVYICDASGGFYGDLYEAIELAKENCFTEIDGVLLTHYHSAHTSSLEKLSNNYKVHNVYLPMPRSADEGSVMRSIVRVLEDENINIYIYEPNEPLDLLSGELTVSDRAYLAGYAHPSVALSFAYGDSRMTLIERPYFDTYLEESGSFDGFISESDVLIFGSDGRSPQEDFSIFSRIKESCEVYFTDFDIFDMSDHEDYLGLRKIFFNTEYKKYDLK